VSQLALPIGLADHAVFASFLAAGNEAVVAHLESLAQRRVGTGAWLSGGRASGKSHLLQAVCAAAGDSAAYLPADMLVPAGPRAIEGFAARSILCIDDIDRLAGRADWERALFNLYNDVDARGGQLVVTASGSLRETAFGLADLASRLSRLPAFALQALAEDDRMAALRLRASHRGLDLPEETARYLLTRTRRDMASLYGVLDRLDREALRAQRRLTVPFVRSVLDEGR